MTAPPPLKYRVGGNIRFGRKLAGGMSQGGLGVLLGVERTRVSDWERGRFQPGESNLRRIAEKLGQPLEWFYLDHAQEGADYDHGGAR